jgi:hypothetical protein
MELRNKRELEGNDVLKRSSLVTYIEELRRSYYTVAHNRLSEK